MHLDEKMRAEMALFGRRLIDNVERTLSRDLFDSQEGGRKECVIVVVIW